MGRDLVRRAAAIYWAAALAAASAPAGTAQEIDELVRATVSEHRLPSLSVAVGRRGELLYAGAHGFADLENAVPATARTVYPMGSVTKTVTAVTALRLAEQGLMDLDADVRSTCTAFPEKPHRITMRQLLGHLAGVRHYDYRRFEEDFLNRRPYRSFEEALTKFADDPLVSRPGERYHYSSWGYVVAGCALEGATGAPYAEVIAEWVLRPAEMAQSRLNVAADLVPHRARGYARRDDGSWANAGAFDPSDRYGAGGLLATPTDLAHFAARLLDGRLLETASVQAMWSSQRTAAGEATGYGLGWDLDPEAGEVLHGGTTVGATALLYLQPEAGTVVALATNLSLWTEGRLELARRLAGLAGE